MNLPYFLDLLATPEGEALEIVDGVLRGPTQEYAIHDGIPRLFSDALSLESNIQKEHYDRCSQVYSENLSYPHTIAYTQYLDSVLQMHSPVEGMGDMAEICCGTGEGIWLFKDKFQRAVGVDISCSMLQIGKKRINDANVLFIQGDALHLPLATEAFDTVIILGGIHHVPNVHGLFAEVARILKPGGLFLAREPANDFFLWRMLRAVVYRASPSLDAKTEHPVRQKEIEAIVHHSGLKMQSWKTLGFLGFCIFMNSDVLVVNRLLQYVPKIATLTHAATKFDAWCLSLPFLKNAGTQAIIAAQKSS